MSSSAEINREMQIVQTSNYIAVSSDIIYLYEVCITISQEVEVIWKQRWSVMTWIYAITRYSSFLTAIVALIPTENSVVYVCKATSYLDYTLGATQFICFACFSALRVYALLDGKLLVAGIIFAINIVPLVTNMYNDATSILIDGCAQIPSLSADALFGVSLGTRLTVIVGDILVLLVTWAKTAQSYREARRLKVEAPLVTMLFLDGTFYFVILLLLNVLQVLQTNIPSLTALELAEPYLATFTPIIVCRFVLNLRQVPTPGYASAACNQSASIRFVGNAGGSLRFGGAEEEGEDDEEDDSFA